MLHSISSYVTSCSHKCFNSHNGGYFLSKMNYFIMFIINRHTHLYLYVYMHIYTHIYVYLSMGYIPCFCYYFLQNIKQE